MAQAMQELPQIKGQTGGCIGSYKGLHRVVWGLLYGAWDLGGSEMKPETFLVFRGRRVAALQRWR